MELDNLLTYWQWEVSFRVNEIAEQDTKFNQNACLFEMGAKWAGLENVGQITWQSYLGYLTEIIPSPNSLERYLR